MWRQFLLISGVQLIATLAAKIPKQLQLEKCNINDKNLDECLRHAIEDAIPKLRNGAPSIGIPKLDDMEILELSLQQGDEKSALALNLKFKNIRIDGAFNGVKVDNFKLDRKSLVMSSRARTPGTITVTGGYQAKGRLLAVAIDGNGPFKFDLYNVTAELGLHFKEEVRKGTKYWDLIKMDYNIAEVGKVKFRLDNLIKGNKAFDESLNQSLNENSKEFLQALRPAFSKATRLYFADIARRFFRKVPVDEIIDGMK